MLCKNLTSFPRCVILINTPSHRVDSKNNEPLIRSENNRKSHKNLEETNIFNEKEDSNQLSEITKVQ